MTEHLSRDAFDLFISYSGRPEVARLVYSRVSKIGVPPWQLRRWWGQKVFFDRRQIRAGEDLPASISDAVQRSRYLLLLASRAAAHSKWVAKELEFWLSHKPASHILIALVDGRIAWDGQRNDFDWEVTDCLPAVLRGRFRKEVVWVNLSRVDPRALTKEGKEDLLNGVASIAAAIRNVPRQEILDEEQWWHRVVVAVEAAVLTCLLALAVTAAVLAARVSRIPADELYTRARTVLDQREKPSHIRDAEVDLDQALKLDPGHERALLAKAFTKTLLAGYSGSGKESACDLEEAEQILSAVKNHDTAAYKHVKGRILLYKYRDVLAARALLRESVELDPDDIDAWHSLASTYTFLRQHERAIELCEKACEVALKLSGGARDKRFRRAKALLAWTLYYAGKYDLAKQECQEILKEDPTHNLANRYLGQIYAQEDPEQALFYFTVAGGRDSTVVNIYANYTCALAMAGRVEEAWANVRRLREPQRETYVSPYRLAECYACLGRTDDALAQLRRARDEGDIFVMWSAVDPLLSRLRRDPEFQDYLRSVGLLVAEHGE